jgi:hypothetical protein
VDTESVKRRLATIGIVVGTLGFALAAPGSAGTRDTRIISYWNGGNDVGSQHYVRHPRKVGFMIAGTGDQGYWLVRHAHWRHWGDRRTTTRGKLASAALSGTPVRIRARRHTYHSCRSPGDTVYFYARVRIHIHGEHNWRRIPHSSLVPQCE